MELEIDLQSPALSSRAKPLGYRGVEAVSSLFDLRVAVQMPLTLELDLAAMVDQPFSVETFVDDAEAQRFSGVVSEVELVHAAGGSGLFVFHVAPRLQRLALTEHSRIFIDKSVPEVVEDVLRQEGITDFSMQLGESYPKREHICQYRESSLAFISRLLEREGIHYAFEHGETGDTVVFRDRTTSAPLASRALEYAPGGAAKSQVVGTPVLTALRGRRLALPSEVSVKDYQPLTPSVDVAGRSGVLPDLSPRVVHWAPNETSRDLAGRRARILSEAFRAREELFEGTTTSPTVRGGSRFALSNHPRAQLAQEYFATRVQHEVVLSAASAEQRALLGFPSRAAEGATAHFVGSKFEAIPASAPFRPTLATTVPRIEGLVDAEVDGPADSEYAQIDDHGRYHVRVRFDEQGGASGSASMWVRMLQPHGGSVEGIHFPLRKGTEVHMLFLGGDPDRPVIAGVAPNASKPSPVVQSNESKNVVQTGGRNRLEMEDARGGQYIDMSTPTATSHLHMGAGSYQFALRTTGQGHLLTGSSLEVEVLGPKTEKVAAAVTENYNASHTLDVLGAFTENLGATLTQSVLGPVISTVSGILAETVTSAVTEIYNASLSTSVCGHTVITYDAGLTQHVTAATTVAFQASQDTEVSGTLDLTISGATTETFGTTTRHIKGTYDVTVDAAYNLSAPNHVINVPHVGLNFSTLSRLSPFQIEAEWHSEEAKATNFKLASSKSSFTGISLSAYGVSISVTGSLNVTRGGRPVISPFKKEDQLLKVGVRGLDIEMGAQVQT